MRHVTCDICGRDCSGGYKTLTGPGEYLPESLDICEARDGGDVGCTGHFLAGLKEARKNARAWLEEHRPYAVKA